MGASDRGADRDLPLRGAGYLNYSELDQSANWVRAAFPAEAFERLQHLKRLHDPSNRFRFNANIPPASP